MKITINNQPFDIAEQATAYDALRSAELTTRATIAASVNGNPVSLTHPLAQGDVVAPLKFEDAEGRRVFWHTAAHVLAHAVKNLYPSAKLAIGPAVDNGFYYDFDMDTAIDADALAKIEKEMQSLIKQNLQLERVELSRADALALAKEAGEDYKVELIGRIPEGESITFYKQGDFSDLCAGPHLFATGMLKAIKLLSSTGAYWGGSSDNKMLTRIYGTAYPDKEQLAEHLVALEEAKKRDHNKLGRELGFFTTVDYIGQGLPVLLPKGAKVVQILQRFVEDEEERRGYQLTKTPSFGKRETYKISSHWDKYRDGMFIMGDADDEESSEVFALRPMTCPFQFPVYTHKMRSYRDLPVRLNETATLFRNEHSGEMHGLIRLRQFTLSDGHIICTPEQLEAEFVGAIELVDFMMKAIGLDEKVFYRFSKWDKDNPGKYLGEPAEWERVQDLMRDILDRSEVAYTEADGEAAFYGPKLDVQAKNVYGKEDTLFTIQIDFNLAQRFDMEYVDADGQKKTPYIIHRSSIGCYERTLAMLIEHYAGAFPTWLAPTQVRVLPVTDAHNDYANGLLAKLRKVGIRAEVDSRNEKIGYRIRESQINKIPYTLVIGDREMTEDSVTIRPYGVEKTHALPTAEFLAHIVEEGGVPISEC